MAEDDLFPEVRNPKDARVINGRCLRRVQGGHCVVLVSGIILTQYAAADRMAQAHAMVSLVEQGWASQVEVARAFHCSERTVRRHQQRFEEHGLAGLGHQGGYPRGRARLAGWRRRLVRRLKREGCAQREIARQLGVSENAVRKILRRLGWKSASPIQTELPLSEEAAAQTQPSAPAPVEVPPPAAPRPGAHPNLSAFCTSGAAPPLPHSLDTDASHRWNDRLLARLGLLEDAAPLFGSAVAVPRAGALLAIPVLVASGVFECAQQIYGSLGPAFYGLRTSLLTLLLMALWRIKRPEGLKEHSPQNLGQVLGLDRAPRSQDVAAQARASGRRATGRPIRPSAGAAAGGRPRRCDGFPLCRRPCAGLSRPTHPAQGPRGAYAHFIARHLRLLGQRQCRRSVVRRHRRGQRRLGQNAARDPAASPHPGGLAPRDGDL